MDLFIHYGGPTKLGAAGRGRVLTWMRNRATKGPNDLLDAFFTAISAQTGTVPGTTAAETGHPGAGGRARIKALKAQQDTSA